MFGNMFGFNSLPFFGSMFGGGLPSGDFVGPRMPNQVYDAAIGPMPGTGAPMEAMSIPKEPLASPYTMENMKQAGGLLGMLGGDEQQMQMQPGVGPQLNGQPINAMDPNSMAQGRMPRFNLRGGLLA